MPLNGSDARLGRPSQGQNGTPPRDQWSGRPTDPATEPLAYWPPPPPRPDLGLRQPIHPDTYISFPILGLWVTTPLTRGVVWTIVLSILSVPLILFIGLPLLAAALGMLARLLGAP
jgi:hypothetical protein